MEKWPPPLIVFQIAREAQRVKTIGKDPHRELLVKLRTANLAHVCSLLLRHGLQGTGCFFTRNLVCKMFQEHFHNSHLLSNVDETGIK